MGGYENGSSAGQYIIGRAAQDRWRLDRIACWDGGSASWRLAVLAALLENEVAVWREPEVHWECGGVG